MSYRPRTDAGVDVPVDAETLKGKVLNDTEISDDSEVNDSVPTCRIVKAYVDAIRDNLINTTNLNNNSYRFVEDATPNGGLTKTNNKLGHSNSVTPGTIGRTEATTGNVIKVPYATYDANGHIISSGERNHVINKKTSITVTLDSSTSDDTLCGLIAFGHSFSIRIPDGAEELIATAMVSCSYDEAEEQYTYYAWYMNPPGSTTMTKLSGTITLYYRE